MPEVVNEAADPKQLAMRGPSDHAKLNDHAHLMSDCHVKPTNAHAADWWKKAHASAIRAMPEEIRLHDAVKGQVGTTLWDVAQASLQSQGQKDSVTREMSRIASLNHISVDCTDLRNKEIRLHDRHPIPLPPEKPCPPYHAAPPARHPEALPEPKVIMAPDYSARDQRPYQYGRYDAQSFVAPPIEPCHQPNILDLLNPFARHDHECRVPSITDQNSYYYDRGSHGRGSNNQYSYSQETVTAPEPERTQPTRHINSPTPTAKSQATEAHCPPGQMNGRSPNQGSHDSRGSHGRR